MFNRMQGIKFVLLAVLAVCASQCQAAEYPISADKLDLRLFVENGAAIAKNLFQAANAGLDKSKPNMDKILNELAPEARTFIRKIIDEARQKLNEEDKRITHIFTTLTKALDRLKPVKTCFDKVSPEAKKLALVTEKEVVAIITGIQKKYQKEIENIKVGTQKVINKARTLFDTEVEAVIKCLAPGNKKAGECLNKEIDNIVNGATQVVVEFVFISETAKETLAPILPEALEKLLPLIKQTAQNGKIILKNFTDCVASLKA